MSENKDHYDHHNPHWYMYNDELSAFFSQSASGSDCIDNQRTNDLQAMPPLGSFADRQLRAPVVEYDAMLERLFDVSSPPRNDMFDPGWTAVHRRELMVDTATSSANGGNSSTIPTTGIMPLTPNSSVSSSSTEAGGEDDAKGTKKDQLKKENGEEEEQMQPPKDSEERSNDKKNLNTQRKKGEKRKREPRVAFMTKSEVDHLEDGYRWRKYGQKAVKNSPHPRSYYRCTHQKCSVKKRVERSFKDPTTVITTYEGQHNHQIPATARGNAHLFAPPPAAASAVAAFSQQDLLMHRIKSSFNYNNDNITINNNYNNLQGNTNPNVYLPSFPPVPQVQLPDYGLLQDIVPSFTRGSQL